MNASRPGARSFTEDLARLRDWYGEGVKRETAKQWGPGAGRSPDRYDPIEEGMQKAADTLKAVKPTFGTDWDVGAFKQALREGKPFYAASHLAAGTAGAALDILDPGLGHAATTVALPLVLPKARQILGPGGKLIEVPTGGRLPPEYKAETDARRQYAGQAARTHPADWSYQLGPTTPPMAPVREFDVNQLRPGDTLHPLVGDRSRVSAPLVEVQGQQIGAAVPAEGGADYTRTPGGVWASNNTVIPTIQNKVDRETTTGTPYGVTKAMSETAIDYSHHAWEPLLWQMKDSGVSNADRTAFDKELRKQFPRWPGVDNTEEALHFLQSEQTSARTPFVNLLESKNYQTKGFPEPGPVRWAMTEPDLRRVPTGASGYGVARLEPGAATIPLPGHTSYDTGLAGTYAGRLGELLPYTDIWRDWTKKPDVAPLLADQSAASRALGKFRFDLPTQRVDQELIDFMGRKIELGKRGD